MLTGSLPFTASNPMEWVHCHIARQPIPPAERLKNVPATVSAIIMKLLAKTAEERYQTAAGVESDLRCCRVEWETRRRETARVGGRDLPENTRLYRDLEEREAKIRRLVDANIMGIYIWNLQGEIIEANDAFLHMLEYSREDVVSGRVRWRDLTPAEWRDRDERAVAEIKATRTFQPFQKEYFRKDGSRVPVMIGGAMFEGSKNEGVAFVLDLSQQKRAEDERKRAEDALQEAQAELAHVTRVAALGELTASIAHEINQPLAAVVNNASACLRWLTAHNLEEARRSASLVIAEGHRAGEIISRIRALAKKAPPQKDWLDINETIGEVIAMARSAVQRN